MSAELITPPPIKFPRSARALAGALSGGRLSADSAGALGYTPALVLSPPDAEGQWRSIDLDLASLDRVPPAKIMQLLADLSPEFSGALWQFQRFLNPGWSCDIVDPAGNEVAAPRARAVVDEAIAAIGRNYGSFGVAINALNMNALLRGAYFAEGVLDAAGRKLIHLAIPDAASVRFRRERDPDLGTVDRLGQLQGGRFVPLDRRTIRYIPIDRFPDSPYGRPPLAAAIFTALFRLGLLRDLRRVVAQQGWPRHDIEIDTEKLYEQMKRDVESRAEAFDFDAFFEQVDAMIARVAENYARLPPDAAFVHTTDSKINRPTGAVDASALGAVDGLMRAVERASVQALKTQGFLLSLSETTTETQAIRQMEAFMQTVRAFQHDGEQLLSDVLTIGLEVQGIPGAVRFRFAENRASEEQRDQMVLQLKLQNARAAYDNGLIDQDDQAKMALGRDKAAQAEPRTAAKGAAPAADPEPEPGRGRRLFGAVRSRRASEPFTPAGADDALPELPDEVTLGDADLDRINGVWDEAFSGTKYRGLLAAEVVED
jgi:hypothetical protein